MCGRFAQYSLIEELQDFYDHVISYILKQQESQNLKQSKKAPKRTGQEGHMFAV